MTFQVGDRIKWKLPRKGTVTEVHEHYFCVQLGDENWSFEHDQSGDFEIIKPVEPVVGSVIVDRTGEVFIRGEAGWYYGPADGNVAGIAWEWKDLLDAYAWSPLTIVYHYASGA